MSRLGEKLLAVHDVLDRAKVAHAFGGAIALAYCTQEPRGTRDIDVNVFVGPAESERVFAALPDGVAASPADVEAVIRDGQVRLFWDDTPLDLFFDVHEFHSQVASEVREVPFEGAFIPVLGCHALVIFKALFNRTKDWADIEAMLAASAFDGDRALGALFRLLGPDDPATLRLESLLSPT